jgi:hypothetical protein
MRPPASPNGKNHAMATTTEAERSMGYIMRVSVLDWLFPLSRVAVTRIR